MQKRFITAVIFTLSVLVLVGIVGIQKESLGNPFAPDCENCMCQTDTEVFYVDGSGFVINITDCINNIKGETK